VLYRCGGQGSVVGIAIGCGLDGPGIESQWGARFSAPVQTGPGAQPASCTMGTESFPGVKSGQGVTLTPHPLLVPWSRKSRAHLYISYGPYSLYRPSVPVQGCTLPFTFYIGVRLHVYLKEEHRLREFANRILRTTVGPEAKEVTRGRRDSITKTVRFVCLTRY